MTKKFVISMGMHPLNLALRFLLEVAALFAVGYWGWTQHQGIFRVVSSVLLPLLAAAIWGTFSTPGDRSRSSKAVIAVPGFIRLIIELALFSSAVWASWASNRSIVAAIFAAVVVLHYGISYARVVWLLKG